MALAAPIDDLIVTAGPGFGLWVRDVARSGGTDTMLSRLRGARLLASNPRAADGLRDLGFTDIWSTAVGTTEELVRYLRGQPIAGRRIVVQCDGPDAAELCRALRVAGADVVPVDTFQCAAPKHSDILRRLVEQICFGLIDSVVLTSAYAAEHLLAQARLDGSLDLLCNTLAGEVPAVCRGPLSAEALRTLGVHGSVPAWPGSEEVAEVVTTMATRRAVRVRVSGRHIEVRGQAVVMNDQLIPVQPGPIGVLRALARHPGQVLSYADIRREMPSLAQNDDHAIEMAVSRLRRSLNDPLLIQTVMRRGYRLPV